MTTASARALVVGGSSTIGRAIALELAGLGLDVTLWGRDPQRLAEASGACATVGVPSRWQQVELTDRPALRRAAAEVSAGGGLAAVVWAAGVFDWAPADRADPDRWAEVLDVNLTAAALTTRLLLPAVLADPPGALVYLGSGAARQAFPDNAAYVASKHGLAGLAGGVWADVRTRGVRVSLISPGLVAAGAALAAPVVQQHPDQVLQPAQVAAAVRFVLTFPGPGCPTEIVLEPPLTG
ncbi:SDR family oxidoreductase [Modestobacter sp. NPDC049651]|uniref:SDR family oxidoreductase n=1 Tax=unclassified Modestobacter TaxID=2643866 RepID=UPI0033E3E0DC